MGMHVYLFMWKDNWFWIFTWKVFWDDLRRTTGETNGLTEHVYVTNVIAQRSKQERRHRPQAGNDIVMIMTKVMDIDKGEMKWLVFLVGNLEMRAALTL
jgi:hypothetical protein